MKKKTQSKNSTFSIYRINCVFFLLQCSDKQESIIGTNELFAIIIIEKKSNFIFYSLFRIVQWNRKLIIKKINNHFVCNLDLQLQYIVSLTHSFNAIEFKLQSSVSHYAFRSINLITNLDCFILYSATTTTVSKCIESSHTHTLTY